MNRRGFLASLVGAAVAAVCPLPAPPPVSRAYVRLDFMMTAADWRALDEQVRRAARLRLMAWTDYKVLQERK